MNQPLTLRATDELATPTLQTTDELEELATPMLRAKDEPGELATPTLGTTDEPEELATPTLRTTDEPATPTSCATARVFINPHYKNNLRYCFNG